MKNFKKCNKKFKLKISQRTILKSSGTHLSTSSKTKYTEINEAIVEWSANFKKVSNKIPTENHMKRDPVIAKIWRKNKVTSKLLKIWKITVHLP